jgi:hypothetical protein
MFMFRNKSIFYGEELLAPHPTPNLQDRPLSPVRGCLFNIFAANPYTQPLTEMIIRNRKKEEKKKKHVSGKYRAARA